MFQARLWPGANSAGTVEYKPNSPYYTVDLSQSDSTSVISIESNTSSQKLAAVDLTPPKSSSNPHKYVPVPLRLPFLAFFLFIFTLCVMLIELTISNVESADLPLGIFTSSPTPEIDKIEMKPSALHSTLHCQGSTLLELTAEYSRAFCSLFSMPIMKNSQYNSTALPNNDPLSAASQWALDIQTVNVEGVSLSETGQESQYPSSTTRSRSLTTGFSGCTPFSNILTSGCHSKVAILLTSNSMQTDPSTARVLIRAVAVAETSEARNTGATMTGSMAASAVITKAPQAAPIATTPKIFTRSSSIVSSFSWEDVPFFRNETEASQSGNGLSQTTNNSVAHSMNPQSPRIIDNFMLDMAMALGVYSRRVIEPTSRARTSHTTTTRAKHWTNLKPRALTKYTKSILATTSNDIIPKPSSAVIASSETVTKAIQSNSSNTVPNLSSNHVPLVRDVIETSQLESSLVQPTYSALSGEPWTTDTDDSFTETSQARGVSVTRIDASISLSVSLLSVFIILTSGARIAPNASTLVTTSVGLASSSSSAAAPPIETVATLVWSESSSNVSSCGPALELLSSTQAMAQLARSGSVSAGMTLLTLRTSIESIPFVSTGVTAVIQKSRENIATTTTEAVSAETTGSSNTNESIGSITMTIKLPVKTTVTSELDSASNLALEALSPTSESEAVFYTQRQISSPLVPTAESTADDDSQTTKAIDKEDTSIPPQGSKMISSDNDSDQTTMLSKFATTILTPTQILTMKLTVETNSVFIDLSSTVLEESPVTINVLVAACETQTSPSTSVTCNPQSTGALSSKQQVMKGAYHIPHYFAALYAAPLLAVLIKILWGMLYTSIRLTQPFERMNTQQGAKSDYSLFAQYLSSSISLDTFKALGHHNVVPLMAALSYVMVQLGAPLASISMTIKAFDVCPDIHGCCNIRCNPRWVINKTLLRGVEATLCACMLVVVVIAVVIRRQRPGIDSDPSSIASISTLLNHEPLLHAIQVANGDNHGELFKHDMNRYRFHLGYHESADETVYGIMSSLNTPQDVQRCHSRESIIYHTIDHGTELTATDENRIPNHHHPTRSKQKSTILSYIHSLSHPLIIDLLSLFFPLLLFILILAFQLDHRYDRFNDFFNGLSAGLIVPKFLLVGLATLSALCMSQLERTVRIIEPFRRLAVNKLQTDTDDDILVARSTKKRNKAFSTSPPETTLLITRSGTAYSSLPTTVSLLVTHYAHGGRMTFQTVTTIAAILADLNILAVTGVPFSEAMIMRQYRISIVVSICVSGLLVLVVLVFLGWWRWIPVVRAVREGEAEGGVETIGGLIRCLGGDSEVISEVARYAAFKDEKKRSGGMKSGGGSANGWFGRRVYFAPVPQTVDDAGSSSAGSGRRETWRIGLQVDEDERLVTKEVAEYMGALQVVEG